MPDYLYKCANGHEHWECHSMTEKTDIYCPVCAAVCHRVPLAPNVTWSGLPPSKGDIPQAAVELRKHAVENRERYERRHSDAN